MIDQRKTDWRPQASPERLQDRARILAAIRGFMAARNILEVQTPVVTRHGITDPNIDSLGLSTAGYLRTSPEYFHKRLLAAGHADLYELGPVFRANEHGRQHRPEFTMLEWYRVGWTWQELAREVVELIAACWPEPNRPTDLTPVMLSWQQCYERKLDGLDPLTCSDQTLRSLTASLPTDCDRDMRLDYLFATRIQPAFADCPVTVVHHYPATQAALARLDPHDPRLAERFEVFLGQVELANGYQELCSASEQRDRFVNDNARRRALGRQLMPLDENLLEALEHGLPECAGVALGVDRLIMCLTGADDIAQVSSFS
jgi:elongation factor P--(R)-beta-lysine ligase